MLPTARRRTRQNPVESKTEMSESYGDYSIHMYFKKISKKRKLFTKIKNMLQLSI